MILWCSYCQKFQGETPPYENYRPTHGMCPSCAKKGFEESDDEFDQVKKIKEIQKKLLQAGLDQNHPIAIETIDQAQKAGIQSVDLLMGVIAPILWKTGDLWESGEITHQDEHRFTTFYNVIIEQIEIYDSNRPGINQSEKLDILLMNAPKNIHQVGIRILNLWLRSKEVQTGVLSQNLKVEEVATEIRKLKPKYFGISVALAEHLPDVQNYIEQLKKILKEDSPQFIIGGNAVKFGKIRSDESAIFIAEIRELLKVLKM